VYELFGQVYREIQIFMSKRDIRVVGVTGGNQRMRVAALATRGYVGEPLMTTPTYTTGVTNANTVVVVTNDKPTVGTDEFRGISASDFVVNTSATVIAQYIGVTTFIPHVTKARGKGEVTTALDTQTELTGLLGDTARFGLASGVYTIQAGGEANTGGLQIVDGNIARGTLDATVDARAMRTLIS
jgi:hypothetical protein